MATKTDRFTGINQFGDVFIHAFSRFRKLIKYTLPRQNSIQDLKLQWRLKPYDLRVLRLLCIQDLVHKSPPHTDVLELGVGGGGGLQLLAKICHDTGRQYIGFDTFSGFPDGVKEDNFFKASTKPIYECFDEKYLLDQLKELGYEDSLIATVQFVRGLLPNTLETYNGKPGFAFLDLDLYESYLGSLRMLYPTMVEGGIILLDEYDTESDLSKWPGAKLAIDMFCNEVNVSLQTHWTGRKYIVKVSCQA